MKKVLMIFLSIALIFTMAAPAFAANGTVADKFAELKAAGILDGAGDAGSMPDVSGTMTREQLAKIAVNLAGLEPTPNVNIPAFAGDYKIGVWGFEQGWIQAAYNADLMKGKGAEGFVARGTVTIAELLTVVLRASGFGSELDNDNWKASAISVATAHGFITGTVNPDNLATYGDLVGQAYNAYQEINTPAVPKVLSVTPLNAKQVKVVFSGKVAGGTNLEAQKKENYFIGSANPTEAVLAADGVTVTLTFANAQTGFTGTVANVDTFTVLPIATAADAKVKTERYVANYSYNDAMKTEITKVEALTNKDTANTITVTFSEPVASFGLVKINGADIDVSNIAFTAGTATATISNLNLAAASTHTIAINNVTDYGTTPNITNLSKDFNVTVDKTAPTVLLIPSGDNEFMLLFSKSMPAAKVVAGLAAAKNIVKDEVYGNVTYVDGVSAAPITPKTANQLAYRITLNDANLYKNSNTRTLTLVFNDPTNFVDTVGNVLATTTASVTLTKDVTAPVITGLTPYYDATGKFNGLTMAVSESLKNATYTINDLLTIVNSKGELVAINDFISGGFKTLPVTGPGRDPITYNLAVTTPAVVSGQYTITVNKDAFTDRSVAGLKNAAATFGVSITAPAAAPGTMTVTAADKATNSYDLTFSSKVKVTAGAGSAYNQENYTLDGKALPAGTVITVDTATQKVVTITLPAAESVAVSKSNAVMTVNNVQSIDGVTVTSYTSAANLNMVDNTKPVLNFAQLGTDNSITIGFNEVVAYVADTEAAFLGDFVVKVNGVEFTLDDAKTTLENGAGLSAGKKVLGLDAYVLSNGTVTYLDLDGNGTYAAANDIVLKTEASKTATLLNSTAIYSITIATIAAPDEIKDAAGNFAKGNVVITVK